jgi:hypothetical protein
VFSIHARLKWKAASLLIHSIGQSLTAQYERFVWQNAHGTVSNINRHFENYHLDLYSDLTRSDTKATLTTEFPLVDLEKAVNNIILWIITDDQVRYFKFLS